MPYLGKPRQSLYIVEDQPKVGYFLCLTITINFFHIFIFVGDDDTNDIVQPIAIRNMFKIKYYLRNFLLKFLTITINF